MKVGRMRPSHGGHGFSLIELVVVLTVLGLLLALAVPAFSDMLHLTRLRGAEDHLKSHLRYAMTESAKRHRSISLTFKASVDGATWCYGLSETTDCDCRVAGSCVYDGIEQVVQHTDYNGISIAPSVSGGRFAVQHKRNTVTAGSVTFTARSGKKLRTVVNGYGRIRTCSPAGSDYVQGTPAC